MVSGTALTEHPGEEGEEVVGGGVWWVVVVVVGDDDGSVWILGGDELLYNTTSLILPDAVVESVECRLPMRKVERSNPSCVKPMTNQIDTCHHLA